MRVIRTVTGDVLPDNLGVTAPHEHLWCDKRLCRTVAQFPTQQRSLVLQDRELVLQELACFYEAGGRSVAEMTVHGWGRDVSVLQDLSRRSGVRVIATSGFYVRPCLPEFVGESSVEELEAFLIDELTEGADGTRIRTGMLKSAISEATIIGLEEKCARAVARAQRRTGTAIFAHSSAARRFEVPGGNVGMQLLDLFEEEGVSPDRVIIGHVDSSPDIRQLAALAARGAVIEFDLIGRNERLLDCTRVDLLCRLVDMGYADRLLLSTDVCQASDTGMRGGRGYHYVLTSFVPMLRTAGFTDELLHQVLEDNPARVLSIELGNDQD